MAEWTNIFELGEWDVYVQYVGASSSPSPDSRQYLVKASELDPSVGTVTVDENGLIVCDFEDLSGEGGYQPRVVVMPATPIAAAARLTCSAVDGLVESVAASVFFECLSVTDEGDGTYSPNDGSDNYLEYDSPTGWTTPTELPSEIASGSGLMFMRVGAAT